MRKLLTVVSALLVLVGLYAASRYSYLFFHSIAEIFSIVVACSIFMLVWNTRGYNIPDYLLLIGIASLFVGALDLLHTLSYAGMNIFIGYDANAPTQLWIAARYMQSLTFLAVPFMLHRRIRAELCFLIYGTITTAVILSVLDWRIFPDCFRPDAGGLTPFKRASEYVICLILLAAGFLAHRRREHFDSEFLNWLLMSIGAMALSELAFTAYVNVFGFDNLLGHYLKIISFYLLYKAVIVTGLRKPYELLFRDLGQQREALQESEQRVRRKLHSVLAPEGDLGELELADIIDTPALQELMNDFYALARIPMSIQDTRGKVLVAVGWQEICTRFHRAHPDACRYCLESGTRLSAGLGQGEYRLYKCKNHMWDMATPIIVAGRQVGNIFTGQFFFEGETIDRALFRDQARAYGFDENQYLTALDRVPRLSRKTIDQAMAFFLKLADTLSQLGYSNARLARLLAERDRLADSLRDSRAKLAAALASMTDSVSISDARGRFIEVNDAFATFHRFRNRDECFQTFDKYPDILEVFLDTGEPAPPDMWAVPKALRGETVANAEYTLRRKDTGETWTGSYSFGPIRGEEGAIVGSVVVGRDITAQKRAEEALHENQSRLETVFAAIPYPIVEYDTDLRIVRANAAAGEAIGLTSAEGFMRDQAVARLEFTSLDGRKVTSEALPSSRALRGEMVIGDQYTITSADGNERIVSTYAAPLYKNDKIIGVVALWDDITEDIRAEEALKRSLDEKEVLLQEIHHRVKNNMQVISSLVSLQAEESPDPAMRGALFDVTHRVRSMALVHEKLYQSIDLARVEFDEYAQSLLNYLWHAHGADTSNARLKVDLQPVSLPVNMAVPCGLILNELFSNALKHAFSDGADSEVAVSLHGSAQSPIRLVVRDNGPGLPAGFDWRQTRSLGLRLVQMLAGQLHATVEVTNDGGTEFAITFRGMKHEQDQHSHR